MDNQPPQTVAALLESQAQQHGDAIAFIAPGRRPLTYVRLYEAVCQTVATLNQLGIGRGDRVALSMPDGPELTFALTAVGSVAAVMPLSMTLRQDEYEYLLTKSRSRALLVQPGTNAAAVGAAQTLNIEVIEVVPDLAQEAGLFNIPGKPGVPLVAPQFAQPDDILTINTTSGTTGRPKLVPKTQAERFISTRLWSPAMPLISTDRLLFMGSMTYAGGAGDLLRTLWAGASMVCTSGFDAVRFYAWLDEFRPTWLMETAHHYRAILAHAPFNQEILARCSLRFLRAGMIALPPEVMQQLIDVFHVPVLPGYAMTETGMVAQISIATQVHKPASVGNTFQSEIAIFDPAGKPLPAGEVGEIVVRGPTIFKGYLDDPEANARAFIDGWFRTGDLGYLDQDHDLFVTGRLREVINRGGAKILPKEVEEALLTHPAVAEAAVFPIPDRSLSEEIGAAVVLRPQQVVSERELRMYAATRLDEGKAPRRIAFVDSLPRTPTGKVQRVGLAERLGLTIPPESADKVDFAPPTTALEKQLVALWAGVLERPVDSIGIGDAFREVGGDSLAATRLVFAIRQQIGVQVTILDLFDARTVAEQAIIIDKLGQNGLSTRAATSIIPIRAGGSRPPLFCPHALNGGVYFYQNLVPFLPADQPIYGLQAVGMDGLEPPLERIEDMAAHHMKEIRSVQTKGPYYLCGYSMGGRLALEVARQLRDQYGEVAYVFCIDDHFQRNRHLVQARQERSSLVRWWRRLKTPVYVAFVLPARYRQAYLRQKAKYFRSLLSGQKKTKGRAANEEGDAMPQQSLPSEIEAVIQACQTAVNNYLPQPYTGPLTYIYATGNEFDVTKFRTLHAIAKGELELIDVPGTHGTVIKEPSVAHVGALLTGWLERHQANASASVLKAAEPRFAPLSPTTGKGSIG